MANARTVTNPAAGADVTATWGGQVYTDIGNLFSDKTMVTDAYASSLNIDCSLSQLHNIVLAGDITLAVVNVTIGRPFFIRIAQGTSAPDTVTWWSGISWPGGQEPPLSQTPGLIDAFMFIPTAAGTYDGYFAGFGLTS